jgi:hypothetical protein
MRIGKHIPSDGANQDDDDGDGMVIIKCSGLKKMKEKNKKLKAKVISIGAFWFDDQDT